MFIDQKRICSILHQKHSFYGSQAVSIRKDNRWHPGASDFIATQLQPQMHVLDIGCGNGSTLLEHHTGFERGVGIDYDSKHIDLAQQATLTRGINNVEFLLMDFPQESTLLAPQSFDLIFSQRGPIDDSDSNIQATLSLLRPDGLIFCEFIGDQHDHEVRGFFPEYQHNNLSITQVKTTMERHRVSIRLTADIVTKWYFSNIYTWLQYQCGVWNWLGVSLPEPDDPRIELFAEQNMITSGEIETTHHVVWIASVKLNA